MGKGKTEYSLYLFPFRYSALNLFPYSPIPLFPFLLICFFGTQTYRSRVTPKNLSGGLSLS